MTEAQQLEAAQKRNAEIREQKFEALRAQAPWWAEELELYRWIKSRKPDYVIFENGDLLDVKNEGGDMDRAASSARANITMPPRQRGAS
ncbi:hypothetical protein AVMA1855_16765 [Acidovorax sp. SUPP1855]|uniref:hypothetical protein n=1 Tax=Acidovorax sp. SUPP1855 TaxID=431774 RepID=UPI0023DE2C32|nr:hypothetical protein [Acidovorax sp. SUPP1855]GKS85827.1 hypothetical protein AVMA1855_16765 [Acidovorax sp. SUPP1855]